MDTHVPQLAGADNGDVQDKNTRDMEVVGEDGPGSTGSMNMIEEGGEYDREEHNPGGSRWNGVPLVVLNGGVHFGDLRPLMKGSNNTLPLVHCRPKLPRC